MVGTGVAFGVVSLLCGLGIENAAINGAIGVAGMIFASVWSNGSVFMALNRTDFRRYGQPWYTPTRYITALCDRVMGVSQMTKLSQAQCVEWGTRYGTFLGMFLYPMFIALGFQVTPWAFAIGLFCMAQGEVYRSCSTVLVAERFWGGFIGAGAGVRSDSAYCNRACIIKEYYYVGR